MNIILAGMPGSGKTTVSLLLGELLGFCVLDTDALIVERYGNISEIFAKHGEEYFRELESETVKRVSSLDNALISTGGGCLLREENVKRLKANGKIVYLKASLETLCNRLKGDSTRPLLQGDLNKNLQSLLQKRGEVYNSAADYVIDTDCLSPEEVSVKIKELII